MWCRKQGRKKKPTYQAERFLLNLLPLSHAATAKSLQSCSTLCDPIDGSPPGSPSLGFSRQEHWSGLPFPPPMHESEKLKWSRSVMSELFATSWTAAYQAPPSMGFSSQEYWSGVPLPSPNRILLSHKKQMNNTICSNMDGSRDYLK